MTKKSDAPAIRFKGFSDAWEQRKLGDVVKEITRNDPESEAPIMMITANNGFIEQSERYAFNNAGESLKKYILLKKGELAYNHGASKLRPYGSCFALTTAENARIPFVYHCFSAENQNAEFMSIELNGAEIENQLRKIVSSGARMDGLLNISFDEYTSVSVLLPGTEEQDRIADFFRHLDNLITLHQRKCALIFSSFQAFFSMMFTTSTFSWEQRKLGDMMNVTSVKRIHQSDWTDSGVRFLRARDIVAAAKNEEPDDYLYISKEKYEEYSALSGKVGVSDLLVTGVGTIGVPYLVRNLEPLYFKDGNIIWFQNSDKIDGKFLFYSFSAEQIQGFINESAGIGTVGTYTIESGKKTPISLPNQIEQAKVGEFFQQLDNLITLHQRELEKLQNIKKSMLEKMFV